MPLEKDRPSLRISYMKMIVESKTDVFGIGEIFNFNYYSNRKKFSDMKFRHSQYTKVSKRPFRIRLGSTKTEQDDDSPIPFENENRLNLSFEKPSTL